VQNQLVLAKPLNCELNASPRASSGSNSSRRIVGSVFMRTTTRLADKSSSKAKMFRGRHSVELDSGVLARVRMARKWLAGGPGGLGRGEGERERVVERSDIVEMAREVLRVGGMSAVGRGVEDWIEVSGDTREVWDVMGDVRECRGVDSNGGGRKCRCWCRRCCGR
jgi:hypothetical protein